MQRHRPFVLVATLLAASTLAASEELEVELRFTPQEQLITTAPDVTPGALDKSIKLRIEDVRAGDTSTIGEGTTADDETYSVVTSTNVDTFVAAAVEEIAAGWDMKVSNDGQRVLVLRVSRYFVKETDKDNGSTYASDVQLAYELQSREGTKLAEGTAAGTATRTGEARNAAACNQALTDALRQAFATALADPRVQSAWASGRAVDTPKAADTDSTQDR